jgi:hypothetical protein
VRTEPFTIEMGPRNTGWIIGNNRAAKRALNELSIAHLWDHDRRCWAFPVQHAETIADHLHRRQQYVALVAVTQ